MPTVALFVSDFLGYSKTFVYEEIRQHTRYRIEVFTKERLNEDRFPFEPVHVAGRFYHATGISRSFDRRFVAESYDLVHAHFGTAGIFAARYARKFGLPLVVTFHGFDVPLLSSRERLLPKRWGYALLGPRLLRQMTLGLCASSDLRDELLQLGVPSGRLRVHRLGVDLEKFTPAPSRDEGAPVHVIMVGRFVEKKGFQYGILAFARYAQQSQNAETHLTLVGSGELEQSLRALVTELGIEARVEFAGVLAPPELRARLRCADILLAPSVVAANGDRESGVIVIKEACACGVVPIGTRHGGIPEIIDDEVTGYLVAERDVDALTDRLSRLADNGEQRRRMAAAGRAKMEREYDNRRRVDALAEHYDEARRAYRRESGAAGQHA
jgi:colanic acid/amylovoran biosynthesis glycosyltransferase